MSLNWELSAIKNWNVLTTHPDDRAKLNADGTTPAGVELRWNPASEKLLWITIIVGMPQITEKNWQEFYKRIAFYEKSVGPMRQFYEGDSVKDVFYTPEEIFEHIGLHTNASTLTEPQFLKKCLAQWHDEHGRYAIRTFLDLQAEQRLKTKPSDE